MPHTDDQNSMGDGSHGEDNNYDYASQLSPSDGQFPASSTNVTPRVPNILVEDPTLLQQQQSTERGESEESPKSREADREQRTNTEDGPLEIFRSEFGYHPYEYSSSRPSSPPRQQQTTEAGTSTSPLSPHTSEVTYQQSSATLQVADSAESAPRPLSRASFLSDNNNNSPWSPRLYPEAPPAYSPSPVLLSAAFENTTTTATTTNSQQDRLLRGGYQTFGSTSNRVIMGAPGGIEEGERLLGPVQPESMGGEPPVDETSGVVPVWARRARQRLPGWSIWKYVLLALGVLIVSVLILGALLPYSFSHHDPEDHSNHTVPVVPIEQQPEMPGSNSGSSGPLFQPSYCRGEQHRYDDQVMPLNFDESQNFTFNETLFKNNGRRNVQVNGRIEVRRLNKGDGEPRMVLEIATNEPTLKLYTSLDAATQEMSVSIPESYDSSISGQRPCVEMKGTLWAPADAEIGTLSLHSVHLDILLVDDLSLRVATYTDLSSVVGDITAARPIPSTDDHDNESDNAKVFVPSPDTWTLDSRVIEVRTTSGEIRGTWPLYDMLGLHSISGSVGASVEPQPLLASNPKPAVLSVITVSGSITATEPIRLLLGGSTNTALIPPRDYLADIRSKSGSIDAALAFTGGATVHSTSGSVDVDVLPVIATNSKTASQLETITTSGTISAQILEPLFFPLFFHSVSGGGGDRILDNLSSTHRSTSGTIRLKYPQSWEGTLYAQSTSGQLKARGRDLRIVKSGNGWVGHTLEAKKGEDEGNVGKSTINVNAMVGGMDALIGDE